MLEGLFNVTVSDKYDTIATVVFLTVLFYGTGIAIDMARKALTDSLPREKLNELIDVLALETGKSSSDVRRIVEARFEKPAAVKRLVRSARQFFRPSQRDGNAPIVVGREVLSKELEGQVPYPGDGDDDQDFDRYAPHQQVTLELHAQDKDKNATGWAAVAEAITDKRLKARIMEPVQPSDIWQKERVVADIVVVSKLTSDGYVPSEIQITAIYPDA